MQAPRYPWRCSPINAPIVLPLSQPWHVRGDNGGSFVRAQVPGADNCRQWWSGYYASHPVNCTGCRFAGRANAAPSSASAVHSDVDGKAQAPGCLAAGAIASMCFESGALIRQFPLAKKPAHQAPAFQLPGSLTALPALPCYAQHPCRHWSPAGHRPSARWSPCVGALRQASSPSCPARRGAGPALRR